MSTESGPRPSAPKWLAELADGDLTLAQRAALTDWLRESPLHVRDLLEQTLIQQDLAALPLTAEQIEAWVREARGAETEPAIHNLERAQDSAPTADKAAWRPGWGVFRGALRAHRWAIAASLLLALTGGVAALVAWQDGRYTTGHGEQRIVALADGSVVTLNTDSLLKVRFSARRRALELKRGEAFFRVAHDATRPFEVNAEGATVKAVGTEFNVRIASAGTIVSVVDGTVEVRSGGRAGSAYTVAETAPKLRLDKGEEAQIQRSRALRAVKVPATYKRATSTSASRATAWTRGRVEFDATPLAEVLREFQRYRDFSVDIDDESVRQLRLTGSFEAHDPASAFAYIDTLPGITVKRDGDRRYLIRRR